MLALTPSSEETDCPSSNTHILGDLGSFASIELMIFFLIAAEFGELSEKLSHRARGTQKNERGTTMTKISQLLRDLPTYLYD